MNDGQLIDLLVGIKQLLENRLSDYLAEFLLLPQQLGHILSLTKLCDEVEIVFGFKDIVKFEQILWIS